MVCFILFNAKTYLRSMTWQARRSVFLVLVFSIVVGARGGEAAKAETGSIAEGGFRSAELGVDLNYLVYRPAHYETARMSGLPVLYLLHGRGDSMDAWRKAKDDLDQLIFEKRILPLIAIMPDAPSSRRAGYYVD